MHIFRSFAHAAAATVLVAIVAGNQARANAALTFYFVDLALQGIGSAASAIFTPARREPPGMAVTAGVAEIIQAKLPIETPDGFAILQARAPAPAAIEVVILAEGRPSIRELDASWGPGLTGIFCKPIDTVWTRWLAMGGTVGVSVRSKDGAIIRQYGIASSDCAKLSAANR